MVSIKRDTRRRVGRIRQQNEQIILQAAEEEFVLNGYKGTSVRDIAARARLPKANIHYYFNSKQELYYKVLCNIVELWNDIFDDIRPEDDPAEALTSYIHAKMAYSRTHPKASRIFAAEIIHGAPVISNFLQQDFHLWIKEKAKVLEQWAEMGKMDPVDPLHLLFTIWATTQHYADFGVQVAAAWGKEHLDAEDFEKAASSLVSMVLKGCGIKPCSSSSTAS